MTVKVELFTANYCPHCARARTALEDAIAELGPERFELRLLDVVREIDHAVELGVLATPAIAIGGELVGTISASTRELKKILESHSTKAKSQKSHAEISHR